MIRPSVLRSKWSIRFFVAITLGVIGVVGLMTNIFRSPRAQVQDALTSIARPADSELRFLVDVTINPQQAPKDAYTRLHFRAGPGPWLRPAAAPMQWQFPFSLILDRRGLAVKFRGSFIHRDGGDYLRLVELPPVGRLDEILEKRWLQVGDKRESSPAIAVTDQLFRSLITSATDSRVLRRVDRQESIVIHGTRTQSYRLVFQDEQLRSALRGLLTQSEGVPALSSALRVVDTRLAQHRINLLKIWLEPRSRTLVRARVELVPRTPSDRISRIILDATVLPRRSVGDVPPAPKTPVRLRPETLRRVFGG